MMKQLVGNFSTKQIISLIIGLVLAIYVVWYVVEALEGFDPDYRPSGRTASDNNANQGAKGNDFFDPSKKPAESAATK